MDVRFVYACVCVHMRVCVCMGMCMGVHLSDYACAGQTQVLVNKQSTLSHLNSTGFRLTRSC